MTEVLMTILVISGMVLALNGLILALRSLVVVDGEATIHVEGRDASLRCELGRKLHSVLLEAGIPIPAVCGGKGTCGLCRVRVTGALDPPLPTELSLLDAHALGRNTRLACQVTVRGDLEVGLPDGLPDQRALELRVRSTRNLTVLIKEIIFDLPEGAPFEFRAGSFVQVECPAYRATLGELPVDEAFREDWARLAVSQLVATCAKPTTRGYSLANYPSEGRIAMLVVRLALPPPGTPRGTPPGQVSTYLFGLRPGDAVKVTGPFGHFVATDSGKEMVFVGGGVGMAPMRAHVFEQLEVLHTQRKLSFWYGARSQKELIYAEAFERLAADHPNFTWSAALSEPLPEEPWTGPTGFIHEHLHRSYLAQHPAPAECEYYLCGPPLMIRAVVAMLERLGVPESVIFFDDFGA